MILFGKILSWSLMRVEGLLCMQQSQSLWGIDMSSLYMKIYLLYITLITTGWLINTLIASTVYFPGLQLFWQNPYSFPNRICINDVISGSLNIIFRSQTSFNLCSDCRMEDEVWSKQKWNQLVLCISQKHWPLTAVEMSWVPSLGILYFSFQLAFLLSTLFRLNSEQ